MIARFVRRRLFVVGVVDPAARKKERMTHFEHTTHTHSHTLTQLRGRPAGDGGSGFSMAWRRDPAQQICCKIITLPLWWRVCAPIPVGHEHQKAWGIRVTPRPIKASSKSDAKFAIYGFGTKSYIPRRPIISLYSHTAIS